MNAYKTTPAQTTWIVLHANINGFETHGIEIQKLVDADTVKPVLILLNETKLERANILHIHGYSVVYHRDRNEHCGGIAVLCQTDKLVRVSLVFEAEECERCWVLVHTEEGPKLICCWYRPPGEELRGIHSFQEELNRLRHMAHRTYVVGDLNVHFKKWLKFSSLRDNQREN